MSKMRNILSVYAMMALMGNYGYRDEPEYTSLTDREKAELNAVAKEKRLERLKQNGVKEYFYGANIIYARNQKNADRKARNNGYL